MLTRHLPSQDCWHWVHLQVCYVDFILQADSFVNPELEAARGCLALPCWTHPRLHASPVGLLPTQQVGHLSRADLAGRSLLPELP